MKITVKTLQQVAFTIEIDDNETVRKLKEKIQQEKGAEFHADWTKLIYSGKIWANDDVLSTCGYDETKFVVIMCVKPKTEPTPASSTVSQATIPAPSSTPAVSTPAPAPKPESTTTTTTATTSQEAAPAAPASESAIVVGADYERIVLQLMEMGYDRPEVERALRASFNNPDRAVEYLISGIPAGLGEGPMEEAHAGQQEVAAPIRPSGGAPARAGNTTGNPLEFLLNQPQFQQMRLAVQQNPQLLATLMQQIGQSNPALLQIINENQEAFLRLLNENNPTPSVPQAGNVAGEAPIAGQPNLDSLIGSAEVSQQDKEAIDRLKALGYPEYLVVQAYFACDKNENAAANFLLSQGFDD